MAYRPDIDGLRTLAVMLVLVFHFDLFALGKAGFIGVDIFFVISGFLITSIIYRDLERGRFSLTDFFYRRIRRLYPAMLTTLLATLIAGWFLLLPYRFEELAIETLLSLMYVINIYFWRSINYFGLQAGSVPLLHMWSLAIEEQFYIIFPIVCFVVYRWKKGLLTLFIALGIALSFTLGVVLAPTKPELAFYLLPTRAWELLVGALLAMLVYQRPLQGWWLHAMGAIGLILVGVSIAVYQPLTQVPGYFSLLPTMGAVALILGGYASSSPVTRILASSPMVWIGKLSYPLYLVHWPILILLKEHTLEFTFPYRLAGFAASFGAAALVYYGVENPIRKGKILNGRRHSLLAFAGLSVATMAIAGMIALGAGLPSRFAPQVQTLLAAREDRPTQFLDCERPFVTVDRLCGLGDPAAPREVIVIGDSHAQALSGALNLWLSGEQRSGALAFHSGCMPVLGAGARKCEEAVRATLEEVRDTPQVKEVILVSIWRQALPKGGKPFLGRWIREEEVSRVFSTQLEETVTMLTSAGKQVTIVEPLFAASGDVPDTLAGNLAFNRNWPVDTPLAHHRDTFASVFRAFDLLKDVRRVSLIEPFCDEVTCRAVLNGQPVFIDDNHLAQHQSRKISAVFAAEYAEKPDGSD
ncbi:MAG: acyltransferase family protein [Pseudomonadota bacterium]